MQNGATTTTQATPAPAAGGTPPQANPGVPPVAGAGQPPPPAAPPAKVEEKTERDAARFAALAKKEKGLVLKAQDLKAREEAVAEKISKYEAYEKARATAKLNPLQLLEAHGVSYEDVTAFVLGDKKPTPELQAKAMRDELEAFKKQQEEERKKILEEERARISAEQKAAVEAFHGECVAFVKAHASEYELTNLHEAHGLVVKVIEENFAKTKRVMTAKEAADLVESYLEGQIQKSIATKKWQARAQPQPSKEAEKRPAPAQPQTLNNGFTASTPVQSQGYSEQERIRRALAALGG